MREKLSPRRLALTERLFFRRGLPGEVKFDVTFGYEPGGPMKEVFCLAFKIGADRQDEMHQACIAMSVALQSGQSMSDLARIMGEDDPALPPHSMIGLIVRAGVMLDDWLTAQYAVPDLPLRTWTEQLASIGAAELTEGVSGDDLAEEDGGTLAAIEETFREHEEHKSQIPPATDAAAAAGVEFREAQKVASLDAYRAAGAEAGEKQSAPEPLPQTSAVGVTAGRVPAPSYRCGDSALPSMEMEIPDFLRRTLPGEAQA